MKDYQGLGLVDINIFPHIELSNNELIKEAIEVRNIGKVYLLPNESFIRIEMDIQFIGDFYDIGL